MRRCNRGGGGVVVATIGVGKNYTPTRRGNCPAANLVVMWLVRGMVLMVPTLLVSILYVLYKKIIFALRTLMDLPLFLNLFLYFIAILF